MKLSKFILASSATKFTLYKMRYVLKYFASGFGGLVGVVIRGMDEGSTNYQLIVSSTHKYTNSQLIGQKSNSWSLLLAPAGLKKVQVCVNVVACYVVHCLML